MEKGLSGGKNSALSTWLILEKSEVGASVKTQTPGFINWSNWLNWPPEPN